MEIVKSIIELGPFEKETLNDLLWNTVNNYPQTVAFRNREGVRKGDISYEIFGREIKKLSLGMVSLGLKKNDKVSLLSESRYEWSVSDFAILSAAAVTVTIYPTLSSKAVQHIVDDSDSKIIIVENREQLEKVLAFREKCSSLEHIIIIDSGVKKITAKGVYPLEEVMKKGEEYEEKNPGRYEEIWRSVKPDDLSSFVYSSGTTGLPKGVMLTHWNWRFNIFSMFTMSEYFKYAPGDPLLAFLPLAHVYMRLIIFIGIHVGATVYFSKPSSLSEDLPAVRPIGFGAVPRMWEKLYERIFEEADKSRITRKKIFYMAANIAREMGEVRGKGLPVSLNLKIRHDLANKLVFSRIRKATGLDRVQLTVSSGSALRKELAYFFNGLEISIIEGYGMTETAGPANINPPGSGEYKSKPGTVGPPLPGTQQKIAKDGEILIKGDNVMLGYHNLPEETEKSFTADGWLKTGDMGAFDKDGYLTFTERKKHIIVLSTGKNVAPLPIEEELKKSRWIEEAVLIGDDRKFISALIQPDYRLILDYADKNNITYQKELTEYMEDMAGEKIPFKVDFVLVKHKDIIDIFGGIVKEVNRNFESFEKVGKFTVIEESLVNELTPTLKIKKNEINKKYARIIEEMYGAQSS